MVGSVLNNGARAQYIALAAETNFAYPFRIFADGDLDVWQYADGATPDPVLDLLTLYVDYNVTGAGAIGGGDVVLVVPATVDDVVTIERNVPIERTFDYSVGGEFTALSLNQQLDKLTMTQQQNQMVNEERQLTYTALQVLTSGDLTLPKLATGQFWKKGDAGALVAVTLEESTGWSALRSELANNLSGADGARIVGYYSDQTGSTTVHDAIDAIHESIPTGIAWLYIGTTAPSTWVMMDDGTIGDVGSGATTRANADCEALFKLIWASVIDTWAPVSTGRGASAQADWDAGKTITLTRQLGRSLSIAGSGAGLTARALGEYLGEEDHALIAAENAPHTHSYDHINASSGSLAFTASGVGNKYLLGYTTGSAGSGTAHNTMQPSAFWNVIIKL